MDSQHFPRQMSLIFDAFCGPAWTPRKMSHVFSKRLEDCQFMGVSWVQTGKVLHPGGAYIYRLGERRWCIGPDLYGEA